MKKKTVEQVDVMIKIVESKKFFKLKVENDTRLKSIANKLCHLMHLDPIATEWRFTVDNENPYEVPITFTLNQIEFKPRNSIRVLLGKMMTTTLRNNHYEFIDIRLRPVNEWYSKSKPLTRTVDTQTEHVDGLDKPLLKKQVLFKIDGTFREKRTYFEHKEPKDIGDIWQHLALIDENRIMRGLNMVGYCRNEKCINYHRWVCIGVGYGKYDPMTRFSNTRLEQTAMCELCPRKDMHKLSYEIVGMFFKECVWKIEKLKITQPKPNPLEYEKWRGVSKEVIGSHAGTVHL